MRNRPYQVLKCSSTGAVPETGGDLALAPPRGGRRPRPGLAAGLASPPPRAPLGRKLSSSRVASSFVRSPSIRSRTARMSKVELCSDNGPADATLASSHSRRMPSSPVYPTVSVLVQCR